MKLGEKYQRCMGTRHIVGGPEANRTDMCKVYGRNVQQCADCAFSILQRPAYLEQINEERGNAEP